MTTDVHACSDLPSSRHNRMVGLALAFGLLLASPPTTKGQEVKVLPPLSFSETTEFCVSPDGEYFGAVGTDANVRVWQVSTGALLHSPSSTLGWTKNCAFTPDNRFVISIDQGGGIDAWQMDSGEHVLNIDKFGDTPRGLLVSSDFRIAVTDQRVFDLNERKEIEFKREGGAEAILNNGTILVIRERDQLVAHDLRNKSEVSRITCPSLGSTFSLKDSEVLFVCNGRDVHKWVPARGGSVDTLYYKISGQPHRGVFYTMDGSAAAYETATGELVLEELKTGQVRITKLPKKGELLGIRPDRRLIIRLDLPGRDRIELLDPESGASATSFITQGAVDYAAETTSSKDGAFLATMGQMGDLTIWNLRDGVRCYWDDRGEGNPDTIQFTPSGNLTVLRNSSVQIYNTQDLNWKLMSPLPFTLYEDSKLVAVSDDSVGVSTVRVTKGGLGPQAMSKLPSAPSGTGTESVKEIMARLLASKPKDKRETFRYQLDVDGAVGHWTKVEAEEPAPKGHVEFGAYSLISTAAGWEVSKVGGTKKVLLADTKDATLADDRGGNDCQAFVRFRKGFIVYCFSSSGTDVLATRDFDVDTDILVSKAAMRNNELAIGSSGELLMLRVPARAKKDSIMVRIGKLEIREIVFSDGPIVFVVHGAGVALVDRAKKAVLATAYSFRESGWAVVTPDGLFDTDRFEDLPISMIHTGMPRTAVSLGAAIRDRFVPRLFARLLAGERPVYGGDRTALPVPPAVSIRKIEQSPNGTAKIELFIQRASDSPNNVPEKLVLLRDGRAAKTVTASLGKPLEGPVTISGVNFGDQEDGYFSAYVFDTRGTRSLESKLPYHHAPIPAEKPTVRILSIGVGRVSDRKLNLEFAPNDATRFSEVLAKLIRSQEEYNVTSDVLLSSNASPGGANKRSIRDAIQHLAKISRPSDHVIISFSGHGFLTGKNEYSLVPSDYIASRADSAVSASDLRSWLQEIDAGQIALVLDTCHSGGAVQSSGFRPGPLGDPSLGQLVYDKKMMVLAASQPEGVTVESGNIRMGALSYVLTELGAIQGLADWSPKDNVMDLRELFTFAAMQTPRLNLEDGKLRTNSQRHGGTVSRKTGSDNSLQPALSDFSSGRVLTIARY